MNEPVPRKVPPLLALALLVSAAALVLLWWTGSAIAAAEETVDAPRMGDPRLPGLATAQRPSAPVDPAGVPLDGQSRAFARAYAWAGLEADGSLPEGVLDDEASAWLPAARELLAEQPVGNWRQLTPAASADATMPGGGSEGLLAGPASEASALPGSGDAAIELPPGHVLPRPRTISQPPGPGAITLDRHALHIEVPDLAAHHVFRAELHQDQPLRIVDRSGGRHVLIVDAADTGDLRLDGGLVVPGRAYLIDGELRITGGSDAHLLIRPVDAVSGFHPAPARMPDGAG